MSNNIYDFDNFSCSARQDIMNTRTYVRNIPSQPLQSYLEARPVLTKYSIMPIVDPRREINTPLVQQATYNPQQISSSEVNILKTDFDNGILNFKPASFNYYSSFNSPISHFFADILPIIIYLRPKYKIYN